MPPLRRRARSHARRLLALVGSAVRVAGAHFARGDGGACATSAALGEAGAGALAGQGGRARVARPTRGPGPRIPGVVRARVLCMWALECVWLQFGVQAWCKYEPEP